MLDFRHAGVRCREHTGLQDTEANRRRLEHTLQRIDAEILVGTFDYAQHFPAGSQIRRFTEQASRRQAYEREAAPSRTVYLEVFADQWFQENQVRWRASYRKTIRGTLDRYLIPAFGDRPVDEIGRGEILRFRSDLANREVRAGRTLSPDRINHIVTPLRMILAEAGDRFGFPSPATRITALPVPRTEAEPFSIQEMSLILASVRADFRNYYTVRFLTGMRTGEIDGLQWRYVDFERRQILVRQSLVEGVMGAVKTDRSHREIDLSTAALLALEAQKAVTGMHDFVFCNSVGQPLDHRNVTKRVWYPLLRHLALRHRNPYQTRHTAASLWLAAGENPEWVARQLGHSSTEMLFRVYSRFIPNVTRRDGSAFESLITPHLKPIGEQIDESTDHP